MGSAKNYTFRWLKYQQFYAINFILAKNY